MTSPSPRGRPAHRFSFIPVDRGDRCPAPVASGDRSRLVENPVAGTTITADYDDQDRLLRYGSTTYAYTANGELLSESSPSGTATFDWCYAAARMTLPA